MDENHSEAKDILRKRILEEKRSLNQPGNPDSSEKKSGSVFQSFQNNSLNDNISLFHSKEDSHPDYEAKDPEKNSVFSSEHTSLQPESLFSNNQNAPHTDSTESSDLIDSAESSDIVDPADAGDAAFPLFLSFKANDSMQTVSEGVREKYSDRSDNTMNASSDSNNSSINNNIQATDTDPSDQSLNMNEQSDAVYSEIDIPIFKPFDSTYEESLEPAYDIPQLFSNNEDGSVPSSSKPGGDPSATPPTVRPGANYTAAQQMGNIAPLGQREIRVKRPRTQSHKPLLILLLSITILVAVFSFWNSSSFDSTFSNLFGLSSDTKFTTSATTAPPTAAAAVTETMAASEETTSAATKPKPTSTPAATQETTASETTKTTSAANTSSAMIPSGFSTTIADGKSTGDTASFNILFKNLGTSDVSLYDGVEFITIAFTTGNIKITEVTSPDFTFTSDPDKSNSFIGKPVSTDVIIKTETQAVAISAKSSGSDIGKYSIKYYVKCYS